MNILICPYCRYRNLGGGVYDTYLKGYQHLYTCPHCRKEFIYQEVHCHHNSYEDDYDRSEGFFNKISPWFKFNFYPAKYCDATPGVFVMYTDMELGHPLKWTAYCNSHRSEKIFNLNKTLHIVDLPTEYYKIEP
jgi:uncharacterized protein YbaR (Trm112 family)